MSMRRRAAWMIALWIVVATAGCERVMRDMYEQPRLQPGDASRLFRDGLGSRAPPPGSMVRTKGDLAAISSGRRGARAVDDELAAESAAALPERPGRDLLLRGRERYSIHCLPCHGAAGDGDGMVVQRGFPAPPSLHLPRLLSAPDRHFVDVIAHGWGVMPSYADRVAPADRWAITAYERALQLSRRAPVGALPESLRSALAALPAAPAVAPTPSPAAPSSGGTR